MRAHESEEDPVLRTLFAALAAIVVLAAQAQVPITDEQRAAIEARIAPAGSVCLEGDSCGGAPAGGAALAAADGVVDGEASYNAACLACHMTGAGGAPIVGDAGAWAERIAKGTDALHASGLNGVAGTTMLAKGGRADLSDEAVIAAVDFMIANSQ